MRRRVVITGIGMVNPMATNPEAVWTRLKNGESSVDYTTVFDASNFPTKIASEVKGYEVSEFGEDPQDWKFRGRHTQFAAGAAVQAVEDSGFREAVKDPTRFGIYLGSGEGKQDFDSFTTMMVAGIESGQGELDMQAFTRSGMENINPVLELEQEPNMPAGHLAAMFDAQGPNANCLTACAASSQAIGEATEIIRRGDADVMLSGGTHSMIHPFGVTGFNLLTALSTRNDSPEQASRPYSKDRDGFVLSEGAGVLAMMREEDTPSGAALGWQLACGSSSDGHHIVAPEPQGIQASRAIEDAINRAGIEPSDLCAVQAHATGTVLGDLAEARSLRRSLGPAADYIPVFAPKGQLGHLLGAAGAVEAIIGIQALHEGILPRTINSDPLDPEIDINVTTEVPIKLKNTNKEQFMLKNSFGFGGHNISIILSSSSKNL